MKRAAGAAALLLSAVSCCVAGLAAAQDAAAPHPTTNRGVGDVPSGDGRITVQVTAAQGAPSAAGLDVALYALSASGAPGLRDAVTDASGRAVFGDVSTAGDVVYLVGVRYGDVPFGQRIRFTAGERSLDVEIPVTEPTTDGSGVRLRETELRVEWLGSRLWFDEVHTLFNERERVVNVPPSRREEVTAPFRALLPPGAVDFTPAPGSFTGNLVARDRDVAFWGPIYPGEQQLSYRYAFPIAGSLDEQELVVSGSLRSDAERLVLLVPETGLELSAPDLEASDEIVEREGRRYRLFSSESLPEGARFEGRVRIPASSRDPSKLALPRADLWLELDDSVLSVSQQHQLRVDGDVRLMGTPEAPLLQLRLPEGAQDVRVSRSASEIVLAPSASQPGRGLDVLGPLPPGESSFLLRYHIPIVPHGGPGSLDLQFPAEVDVVNLLIADTGVAVEDERLHRLRPVQSGSRMYLRREAFHVTPDEQVTIQLKPIARSAPPRWASAGAVLLAALAGAAFIVRPLQGDSAAAAWDAPADTWTPEGSALVEAIRDLDHDFDTGKVERDDYERMRGELRARALGVMRRERDAAAGQPAQAGAAGEMPSGVDAPSGTRAAEPSTRELAAEDAPAQDKARQCTACGSRVAPGWRFCAGCGADLDAASTGGASQG